MKYRRSWWALALALTAFAAHADIAQRPATEDLIVTATRVPAPRLNLIGNTTRLDEQRIALTNHQHINELGTAAAGTWISRGSGQENLTAIRSPVLTGPGACGAFLTLENGIPTRPTGFCNVNQLFEIPSELASSAEALRGPANALYGSNGLHGTLNFLLPRPAESPGWRAGLEAGPDDFRRLRITADATPREQGIAGGLLVDHYDGFRADSGYDQQKGYLEWAPQSDTSHLQLTFSGSHLDQQTAGFIRGFEAYKDPELRISNPDPDAFRKGDSQRVSLHWQPAGNAIDSRLFMRRSDMEFLQHFLPGKPLEQNGQISGGWMLTVQRDGMGGHLTAGTDAEFMSGFLREIQAQEIAPDSNRPAGRHYDYDVNSQMAAVYAQFDRPVGRLWTVQAGLRLEYLRYGYDNKLPDGNTRDDGTNCPAGCLFYRPADRSDDFLQAAPNLGLLFRIDEYDSLFASLTRGFRAPQATELYRLQNGQTVADLKPETLDSVEVGWHRSTERLQIELTGFAMRKHNVIFRDSNGFNVSDGRTMHAGVELQAFARAQNGLYTGFAGTFARHRYDFDRQLPGGESIHSGDDVDTAPRELASLRAGIDRPAGLLELEWVHQGSYFLNPGNTARYPGHDLLNLRALWRVTRDWAVALRINNLSDRLYADRADFAFGHYRYLPGRRREVFVEITYRWF